MPGIFSQLSKSNKSKRYSIPDMTNKLENPRIFTHFSKYFFYNWLVILIIEHIGILQNYLLNVLTAFCTNSLPKRSTRLSQKPQKIRNEKEIKFLGKIGISETILQSVCNI